MNNMWTSRSWVVGATLLGAGLVSACGGGGGSPGGGVTTPAPPTTVVPTPTPPTPPLVIPLTSSSEYRRTSSLALIKPEAAWSQGATGAGITVAVIDTGVSTVQGDLGGRLVTFDVISGRTGEPEDDHGTHVASIIGAGFNNSLSLGVAYDVSILGLRADSAGSCASEDDCEFRSRDVATAIDYARTHGAQVINISLGSDSPSSSERAALQRAVDAGIAIVASAGNDGLTDPGYPGRFAIESGITGGLIAAGALNEAGSDLASFSNRAGVAQAGYLAAPGERVRTNCTTSGSGTSCWSVSGTSFAAPHIAGALALLLDGFPNISGRDAIDILLRSARDMGDAGTDSVYGRGALDIQRAFQPLGTLSTPTAAGAELVVDGAGATPMSSLAFGDALQVAEGLSTVGYDDYHRLFRIHLGASWASPQGSNGLAVQAPITRGSSSTTPLPRGGALRLAVETAVPERLSQSTSLMGSAAGEESATASVSLTQGRVRFDLWNGDDSLGGPVFAGAPADSFVALAQAGRAVRAGVALGRWTFSAESGAGVRDGISGLDLMADPASGREQSARYSRAVAAFAGEGWGFAVASGALSEPAGPLGSVVPVSSSFVMPAQSRFTSVQAAWRPADGLQITARSAFGRTEAEGEILSLRAARSSSWSVRADIACARLGMVSCSGISLSLSQPLRVDEGRITAILADLPAEYSDPLTFSARDISFAPSGRQIDLSVGVWRPVVLPRLTGATLHLDAVALLNPGHRADAKPAAALNASFRTRF